MIVLNVAEEFTSSPIGRYRKDSEESGEVFREDILRPVIAKALAAGTTIRIDFSGMDGLNPSFLDEGFAALAREPDPKTGKKLTADQILALIKFDGNESCYALYIQEVKKYIRDTDSQNSNGHVRE